MKKKITLQKATVAAGVVAMSVGLFNSFNVEANEGSSTGCDYPELNFEDCRDNNCNPVPSLGCTFWYGADLITVWAKWQKQN